MAERAYYPMRTDAVMGDDAPVTGSTGCPALICFFADGRCGRAFLAIPVNELLAKCVLINKLAHYKLANAIHKA